MSPSRMVILMCCRSTLCGLLGIMPQRMPHRFEMHKDIGKIPSLQRKRPPMQHRMTLIQDHIPRLHCNIISFPIMPIHLNRPRLVHVLIHVNNRRTHQRHPIHMSRQNRTLSIHPNPIQRTLGQLLSRPLLNRTLRCIPYPIFSTGSSSTQLSIFHTHHVGRCDPVIGISVPRWPIFIFPVLTIFVFLPEFLDFVPYCGWCLDFLKADIGIVLHTGWLS
mmetsp:Transcript_11077/g.16903  ORF Transcript_11077/g.16903 Transcript_11077/m.16903 type:complete len:219 (+) Transcript_11077:534-1190(+)